MSENWIAGAIKKPGALHTALKVPQGNKIPASKLAAKPGDSAKMAKRKSLAKTLEGFHGKGGLLDKAGAAVDKTAKFFQEGNGLTGWDPSTRPSVLSTSQKLPASALPKQYTEQEMLTKNYAQKQKDNAYRATLKKEAPETLRAPKKEEFANEDFYKKAADKFASRGNWATEEKKPTTTESKSLLTPAKAVDTSAERQLFKNYTEKRKKSAEDTSTSHAGKGGEKHYGGKGGPGHKSC